MKLGEILVTLYKVGTQIRAGLDLFDRIVVPAKEALDLVKNDVWEDHPDKAKFVALPDEEKKKCDAPDGCGRLTNSQDFTHEDIEALVKTDEKPKPEPKKAPKDDVDGTGTDNNGEINGAAPANKGTIAAPKKAPKSTKAKAAPKPKGGAAAGKNTESTTEEKPEIVKLNDDQSHDGDADGKDHDDADSSKD